MPVLQPPRRSLPQQIATCLRQEIAGLSVGTRLPPEPQLAERFGVSIVTLRQGVLLLIKDGLLVRIHGSGTYVQQAPTSKSTIGVIIEQDIAHPAISVFHLRSAVLARQHLAARGHAVRMFVGQHRLGEPLPTHLAINELLAEADQGTIIGVIATATTPQADWRPRLDKLGIPVVGAERGMPHYVDVDTSGLVREGVRQLAAQGRRRLALIAASRCDVDAFRSALNREGLPEIPGLVAIGQPGVSGAGFSAFHTIWRAEQPPDGLLVSNDQLFPDVATGIMHVGAQVPDRLAVVTHANRGGSPFCVFPVGRLVVDPGAWAEKAVALLDALVRRQPVEQPHATIGFAWNPPVEGEPSADEAPMPATTV